MSNTTHVRLKCKCGKSYLVRRSLVGDTVKCRNCMRNLIIAKGEAAGDPLQRDEPNSKSGSTSESTDSETAKEQQSPSTAYDAKPCPNCRTEIYSADICLTCGYDLRENKIMGSSDASQAGWQSGALMMFAFASVIVVALLGLAQTMMTGPVFLFSYGVLCITCRLFVIGNKDNHPQLAPVAALGTFVMVGLVRVVWGMQHNMHKFQFLWMMMFIGGIAICAGFSTVFGNKGSGAHYSTGYSSCGGGGCGGGGGGCGGCGG